MQDSKSEVSFYRNENNLNRDKVIDATLKLIIKLNKINIKEIMH